MQLFFFFLSFAIHHVRLHYKSVFTTSSDRQATQHVIQISDLMLSSLVYFIPLISGDNDCPEFINSHRGSSGSVSHSYSSGSTVCDANSPLLGQEEGKSWIHPYAPRRGNNGLSVFHTELAVRMWQDLAHQSFFFFFVTTKRHGALRPLIAQLQDTHRGRPSGCQTRRKMQDKLWHVCLVEPGSWAVLSATLIESRYKSVCRLRRS